MDIHRSRFVPYPTSTISALAFSRNNDSGYAGPLPALKLAIGRTNGNIEIWNPQKGLWVQEAVFAGNSTSIDGLAWTQDPDDKDAEGNVVLGQQRLFSIAASPAVTEWNLATGQPKRKSTGNFSEVWCFAAQLRWKPQKPEESPRAQEIVAGCGDGTMVLLSTTDNDLQFKRFLARVSGKRARCMSVTYQSRDRVVAGFADGVIRIYDTRNASLLRTMSLGISLPDAPKNVLVWQVKCLPNGDIVSGDSNGELKVWDGRTYSLLQRISGHDSDCLDLVVSSGGRSIMSGSLDGRLAMYKQSNGENGRKSWARAIQRRAHHGEIKAMTAFDSKNMSVAVSGGSDATPMVTPFREYGKENSRALPSLPQKSPVTSAPKARLLVSWWDKTIQIWRIAKRSNVNEVPEPHRPRKLVAKINLQTRSNVLDVSISPDGRLLAASTDTEVKVFQLRKKIEQDGLAIRRLEVSDDLATSGAHVLKFSPDCKWLVSVAPDSEVSIVRCKHDPKRPKQLQILAKVVELERRHRRPTQQTGLKDFDRTITQLAFSADSSVLVVGDRAGYLDSWVLEGHEDMTAPAIDVARNDSNDKSSLAGPESASDSDSSDEEESTTVFFGQHWTDNPAGHLLPKLDSTPLVMTFRPPHTEGKRDALVNGNPGIHSTRNNPHAHSHELPSGRHRLWILTSTHRMFEFDLLAGRLSDWSRKNPTASLPEDFIKIRDRVMGTLWEINGRYERLWLYGSSFVGMLNVGVDLVGGEESQALAKKSRKPKRGADSEGHARKRRKLESGAGGRIERSNEQATPEGVMRHADGTLPELGVRGEDKSEDDDDDIDMQLTHMRSNGDEQEDRRTHGNERKWWSTFKYRPILGIVPLEDEEIDGEALEVVLVERPLWDIRQ